MLNGRIPLAEVAKQVPALIVYFATVYIFIGYIERHDINLTEISRKCHMVSEHSNEVIEEVNTTLGQNHELARQIVGVLEMIHEDIEHRNGG